MKRLVLDAGPLIALVSVQDDYHQECKAGFIDTPTPSRCGILED